MIFRGRSVSFAFLGLILQHDVMAFEGCPVVDVDWEEAAIQIFNGRTMFSPKGTELQRSVIAHILSAAPERPFDCVEAIASSLLSYSQAAAFSGHAAIPLAALRLGYAFISARGSFPNCTAWPLQERDYHDAVARLSRRPFFVPQCSVPEIPAKRVLLASRCADSMIRTNHKAFARAHDLAFVNISSLTDFFTDVIGEAVTGHYSSGGLDWILVVDCGVSLNATATHYREPCTDHDVVFGEDSAGLLSSAVWFRANQEASDWLSQWAVIENTLLPLGVSSSFTLQYTLLRAHVWKQEVSSLRRWPQGVESASWMISSTPSPAERFNLTAVPDTLYERLSADDLMSSKSMLHCSTISIS